MIFGAFNLGCAENMKYRDRRFDEFQAFTSLLIYHTPQGQSRMENFFDESYIPHGDRTSESSSNTRRRRQRGNSMTSTV